MKLPFRRPRKNGAEEELRRAEDRLRKAKDQWPEVYRAQRRLEHWIEENLKGRHA